MASRGEPEYKPASPKVSPRQQKKFLYEKRVLLLSVLCSLPAFVGFSILAWELPWSTGSRWSIIASLLFVHFVLILVLHDNIIRPLQTLTNVVSALREEDYSFRARGAVPDDALGELAMEINSLADLLAEQRTHTIEATALLRRVVAVIDVPLFAFDPDETLRLVNFAGEQLLQKPASALVGRNAQQIGFSQCLTFADESQISLPQAPNKSWLLRRSQFRQDGVPHTLIVLSDVSRALRQEERTAWQRLIRVLGHELNNSLTPIKSIAGTLSMRIQAMQLADQERNDFSRGLSIIESRSASLNRFLQAYRRLAQMPSPTFRTTEIAPLIERVASLETRLAVTVAAGPPTAVRVDPDQIEQMMINLIKNATEAALDYSQRESPPRVEVAWKVADSGIEIRVTDNGPGLLNPDNAFVPFYTTKTEGTGIGLVVSRQIAESHSGSLHLVNRSDAHGCVAIVSLPLNAQAQA